MEVVYVDGVQPKIKDPSVFLAGPTPRDYETPSWRPDAIEIFKQYGFEGQIFVPENCGGDAQFEYYNQVEWEWDHLHGATIIMFWVPREIQKMPGLTTNVEFGYYLSKRPERCVYGRPEGAPKMSYLDWLFSKSLSLDPDPHRKIETTLEDTVKQAIGWANGFVLTSKMAGTISNYVQQFYLNPHK